MPDGWTLPSAGAAEAPLDGAGAAPDGTVPPVPPPASASTAPWPFLTAPAAKETPAPTGPAAAPAPAAAPEAAEPAPPAAAPDPPEEAPAEDAPDGPAVTPEAVVEDDDAPEPEDPRANIIAPEGAAEAMPPPPEPDPMALTAGTANFISAGRATMEAIMNTNPTIGPAMLPCWSPKAPPLIIQKQVA